jgi:hypothetical protein
MKNLTLDDFYNPSIMLISKIVTDSAFIIHFSFLPFILFALYKNSKNMESYRWYLLNDIWWNTLYCFLSGLITPAFLGTYPIGYVDSYFRYCCNIHTWYTALEVWAYCLLNMGLSVTISIAYRFMHLFNLPQHFPILEIVEKQYVIFSGIGIFQFGAIIAVYIAFEIRRADILSKENFEHFLKEAPFLSELFPENRAIGKKVFAGS